MTITIEKKLRDFTFWGGAVERRRRLTNEEMDRLEDMLDPTGEEQISATELNDYIWFSEDDYLPALGISEEEWEAR